MHFFIARRKLLVSSKITLLAFSLLLQLQSYGQPPIAGFTVSQTSICLGATTLFSSTSAGNINSYLWNFGAGANPATANTAGPHVVSYTSSGAKTISLTVTGPGGNNTTSNSNLVTVGTQRIMIMSYNLLNYPDNANPTSDSTVRNPYFRTVLAATLPDILVVNEMNSQSGVNWFLSQVLNKVSSGYAAGTFINGFDTDNAIFYRTSKFSFVTNNRIITDLRDINEFKLVHNSSGDTLRIYGLHLKSSAGGVEEAQRALEVDSLRKVTNALPAGSNFIVCGDFNIYKSSESAYQKLVFINPANEGHVIDPQPLSGTWNNAAYAIYHTQSTRTRSFNNGANGGLNDRFDMMLYSKAIGLSGGMTYVSNSATAYGNDGVHYNDSINHTPNYAVGQAIADALEISSDHLPIYANFDFIISNCIQPDIGMQIVTAPTNNLCANSTQALQVQIKNYGTTTIDFSTTNTNVVLKAINPSLVTTTFSKTISTGILSPGNSMLINFDSTYTMLAGGNYSFNGYTLLTNDANLFNDSMPITNITIIQNPTPSISPSGAILLCEGDTVTLHASGGNQYLWSNGATTASVTVTDTGFYSVSITNQNICTSTSNPVHISYKYFPSTGIVFNETMGSVAATTTIAQHETNNGFDIDNFTFSGTADVRNTSGSTGYTTASAGANVFISNTIGKFFTINGINTFGYNNLALSFGLNKNSINSTGTDFIVETSIDGINYVPLNYPPLSSGGGWKYVVVSDTIPSVTNLNIRFRQNGSLTQYRVDDVLLTYNNQTPTITANGATTFCNNDSVKLSASSAFSYLWSNGSTTQNIVTKTTGNYSVTETAVNGCTASSTSIQVTSNYCNFNISAKVLIEGYYNSNGLMNAVVDPINSPFVCDTIEMKLAQPIAPYSILYNEKKLLAIDGTAMFNFTTSPQYGSYYVIIRHRNGLETWSQTPVEINTSPTTFDFSVSTTNNLINNKSPKPIISKP